MIARYDGFCALCVEGFEAGTEVTKDTQHGYVHAKCWRDRLPEEDRDRPTKAWTPQPKFRTKRGHRGVMS